MESRIDRGAETGAQTMRNAGDEARTQVNQLADATRETGRKIGAAWENVRSNVQEKTVASAKATDRVIRDYPYQSIGIAFGVGLLVGMLITRR